MTSRVRLVLSYTILSPVKVDIFPLKINIVVTDVISDITYFCKNVNTRVVIILLLHDVIHWKTATSYDKMQFKILNKTLGEASNKGNGCLQAWLLILKTGLLSSRVILLFIYLHVGCILLR